MSYRADLHIHSFYSDGKLTPEQIVTRAKRNGVNLISLTDHDNMCGLNDMYAAIQGTGVSFVKGMEVSAYDGDVKVHTLGYGMDESSLVYRDFYQELYDGAEQRCYDILQKINEAGVRLSIDEVDRFRTCKQSPFHGMHVAFAGADKGYADHPFTFFNKYLAYGCPGYSGVGRPSPEHAVKSILACGGFASLAHPGRISLPKEGVLSLIERMVSCGLGGIEAVYSGHTTQQTEYYKEIATKFGLVCTGGSDTHYPEGNRQIGTPFFTPDQALLQKLAIIER